MSRRIPSGIVVSWTSDPSTVAHRVILEQDENDGLVVQLPAGANEFRVPDGFLLPGTETHVEVGAVAANGNTTLVEVGFSTR